MIAREGFEVNHKKVRRSTVKRNCKYAAEVAGNVLWARESEIVRSSVYERFVPCFQL